MNLTERLIDGDGYVLAVRYDRGPWIDPYGGTFGEKDITDMTAFAAGQTTAEQFGVPSLRLVSNRSDQ